jgi:hypothetical protein
MLGSIDEGSVFTRWDEGVNGIPGSVYQGTHALWGYRASASYTVDTDADELRRRTSYERYHEGGMTRLDVTTTSWELAGDGARMAGTDLLAGNFARADHHNRAVSAIRRCLEQSSETVLPARPDQAHRLRGYAREGESVEVALDRVLAVYEAVHGTTAMELPLDEAVRQEAVDTRVLPYLTEVFPPRRNSPHEDDLTPGEDAAEPEVAPDPEDRGRTVGEDD